MQESNYVNENGFFVFRKGNSRIEVDGPINSAHTLQITGTNNEEEKVEIGMTLTTTQLRELGHMLVGAAELSESKSNRAEEVAYILMELDLPIENIMAYLKKVYKNDHGYGEYLRDKLLELVDYQADRDYDNDKTIYWFNQLNKSFSDEGSINVESTNSSENNINAFQLSEEYFGEFSGGYESESDYWQRVAEDSDMTLEEYFNSED